MKKNTGEKEDISKVITNHRGAGCSQNNCIMHRQGSAYLENPPTLIPLLNSTHQKKTICTSNVQEPCL